MPQIHAKGLWKLVTVGWFRNQEHHRAGTPSPAARESADVHTARFATPGWLQQTGDPRGEDTRMQLQLKSARHELFAAQLARLRTLYAVEHPSLCGRFEPAGVFEANLLGVEELSWGVWASAARETGATDAGFAYHQQPPLPVEKLNGTYDWLRTSKPYEPEDVGGSDNAFGDRDLEDEDPILRPGLWRGCALCFCAGGAHE